MSEDLPEVTHESYVTIAPELTIKVLMLSDGRRIIPEEEMVKACEWLGVDMKTAPDVKFKP